MRLIFAYLLKYIVLSQYVSMFRPPEKNPPSSGNLFLDIKPHARMGTSLKSHCTLTYSAPVSSHQNLHCSSPQDPSSKVNHLEEDKLKEQSCMAGLNPSCKDIHSTLSSDSKSSGTDNDNDNEWKQVIMLHNHSVPVNT